MYMKLTSRAMLTGHLPSRIWCTTGVQSQFTAAGNSSLCLVLLTLFPLLFSCSSPYFALLFIPRSLLSFLFHFQIFFFLLSFSSFFSTSFYSASPYLLVPPPSSSLHSVIALSVLLYYRWEIAICRCI